MVVHKSHAWQALMTMQPCMPLRAYDGAGAAKSIGAFFLLLGSC